MNTIGSVIACVLIAATAATAQTAARPRVVEPKPTAATAQPMDGDKWKITTEKNPMNDKPTVTASLRAEVPIKGWLKTVTPSLVVRCQTPLRPETFPPIMPIQPGLEFYIVTGMAATVENAEGKHTVHVRFDDQPSEGWGTSESTDKEALFFAPFFTTKAIVTHHTLAESKTMLVQFTPFNGSPVIAKFDVRGFAKHAERVLSACPPVDQTKWRFPPGQGPKGVATAADLIGKTEADVRATLGEPSQMDGSRWTYSTGDGQLFVYVGDGKVADVRPREVPLSAVKR